MCSLKRNTLIVYAEFTEPSTLPSVRRVQHGIHRLRVITALLQVCVWGTANGGCLTSLIHRFELAFYFKSVGLGARGGVIFKLKAVAVISFGTPVRIVTNNP